MNSPDRAFPVRIDPEIKIKSQNDVADTFVDEQSKGVNSGNLEYLHVDNTTSQGQLTYLKFNLPILSSTDQITSSSIHLTAYNSYGYNAQNLAYIDVLKASAAWDENLLTWRNQVGYDSRVIDCIPLNISEATYVELNVTSAMVDFYNGKSYYGFVLKGDGSISSANFYSSEYSNSFYRPYLIINYINNQGIEDYWTYHTQQAGRAGTGYINDYTGSLVWIHDDYSTTGSRMPLSIKHVYRQEAVNSTDDDLSAYAGWNINYRQRVWQQTINSKLYYVYLDEDGTKIYFPSASNITDDSGKGLSLQYFQATGKTVITDKKGNTWTFEGSMGRLTQMKAAYNRVITITYDDINSLAAKILSITDGAGRTTTLNYQNELLSSIVGPDNMTTSFEYTNGELTSIVYLDNEISSFEYDQNGYLLNATDIDGYKMTYEYNAGSPNRVQRVLENHTDGTLGGELNIEYKSSCTIFTDEEGRSETYKFNYTGNTVSVSNFLGYEQSYQYIKDGKAKNKISTFSRLQKSIINYIKNSSFETISNWSNYVANGANAGGNYDVYKFRFEKQGYYFRRRNTTGEAYFYQTLNLAKGKTYTLSGYVLPQAITGNNNNGVALLVKYIDNTGNPVIMTSPFLNDSNKINGWQRLDVTFTLPIDAQSDAVEVGGTIVNETGDAYFDGFQLEEGTVANSYNLLQDPDFTNNSPSWVKSNYCSASDTIGNHYDREHPSSLDNNCISITGKVNIDKNFSQVLNLSGSQGSEFSLSGWAKANSTSNGSFQLKAEFYNYGYSTPQVVSFAKGIDGWQYATGRIKAPSPFSSIRISVSYGYNANTAYFDGIQLTSEASDYNIVYDTEGNATKITNPLGNSTNYEYSNNDVIRYTDALGNTTNYTYSGHLVTLERSPEEIYHEFNRTYGGNLESEKIRNNTGSLFIKTENTYDQNYNYPVTSKDSLGNVVTYNYDENSGTLDTVTDPKGFVTSYGYDDLKRLIQVSKESDGVTIENTYSYEYDRLSSISHNGFSYGFDYDSLGQSTGITVAGQQLVSNQYTPRTGLLSETDYGNGQSITYEYDDLDRNKTILYNGIPFAQYEYDSNGNTGTYIDLANNTTYKYTYDSSDKPAQIYESSFGSLSIFTYDSLDRITNINLRMPGTFLSTRYGYNKDGKLKNITFPNYGHEGSIDYNYDIIGRLTSKYIDAKNGEFTTNYTYLDGAYGTGSTSNVLASINNDGNIINYAYDPNNNITSIIQNGQAIGYNYNELNEVTREDNQSIGKTITYSYDGGGNITVKSEYAYTTDPVLLNPVQTIPYTYDPIWKDLLTSYNGKNITYDEIGNPQTYDGFTYSWIRGRLLDSINGNGQSINYKYNDTGIRVEKTVNGVTTKYLLVGNLVTYETNGTDSIYYFYDPNGKLVSMTLNGTDYYYIRNGQNDIIGLFDNTGTQVVSYTYDTWGKLISIGGTLANTVGVKNPYRYRGYRYDTETGLYYLQSRYYNPEWGRFINADAILGQTGELLSHNLFAYCKNNPVNMVDINGHSAKGLIDILKDFWKPIKKAYDIYGFLKAFDIGDKYAKYYVNHMVNVLNVANGDTSILLKVGNITENQEDYINQCKNDYDYLVLMLGGDESLVKNKSWDELDQELQANIYGMMGSWAPTVYMTLQYDSHKEMGAWGSKIVY